MLSIVEQQNDGIMRKARYIVVSVLMAFFAMIAKAEDSAETDTAVVENGEEEGTATVNSDLELNRLMTKHDEFLGTEEGVKISDSVIWRSRELGLADSEREWFQMKLTDLHSISQYDAVNVLADSLIVERQCELCKV